MKRPRSPVRLVAQRHKLHQVARKARTTWKLLRSTLLSSTFRNCPASSASSASWNKFCVPCVPCIPCIPCVPSTLFPGSPGSPGSTVGSTTSLSWWSRWNWQGIGRSLGSAQLPSPNPTKATQFNSVPVKCTPKNSQDFKTCHKTCHKTFPEVGATQRGTISRSSRSSSFMGPTVARGGGRACKHLMHNASLCILNSKVVKHERSRKLLFKILGQIKKIWQ